MGSDGDEATDIELEKSLRRRISTVVFVIGTLLFYLHSTDLPSLIMDQISSYLPCLVWVVKRCKRRLNLWSDSLILLRALISPFSPSDLLQSNKSLSSSLIPMFDLYGVGLRQALDMSTQDESLIIANDATLNDMEGSAVAYVAELLKVPVMFLKAVTDLIDGDKPTAQEFLQNLSLVTSALEETATKVTNFINGKNPFRPLTIIST